MLGKRYTILIADRSTGVVRSVTVRLRPALAVACAVALAPIVTGVGARWGSLGEIATLRESRASLEEENASYRAATAELASQIGALQGTVTDLSQRSNIDPAAAQAVERLPSALRNHAMGGALAPATGSRALTTALTSPESTFGVLKDLLGALESRLRVVEGSVDRRRALASATPSIWPAHGWLSASYGVRPDPFTGERAFHPALDISTDRGQPVYATATGTVESASYSGAYGNLVVIKHDFGLRTRYGHLSAFKVKPGDKVKRGDVIGLVGATGRATGAHVHYEVWANGRPLNPLQLLTKR
jgi:murein DD-endopeptidase MepM/ murein hydrolase activator NlpD